MRRAILRLGFEFHSGSITCIYKKFFRNDHKFLCMPIDICPHFCAPNLDLDSKFQNFQYISKLGILVVLLVIQSTCLIKNSKYVTIEPTGRP